MGPTTEALPSDLYRLGTSKGKNMKKLIVAVATCAVCALATSQPMPGNDRSEIHDMNRSDHMDKRETYQQQAYREDERNNERHDAHHRHKVWVPSHHDDHEHVVRGHYEWR